MGAGRHEGYMVKQMDRLRQKVEFIINTFSKLNPNPTTELKHRNPYELVVATILSAQCTDERVNRITPALFKRFPTPQALARASPDEVYEYIKTCSYPNNKARYLVKMAKMIVNEFGGKVPTTARELMKLPGVGRKSANVIAATLFNEPVIGVDTHVFRVSKRLGLHNAKTSRQVEKVLTELVPEKYRPKFHHWLILHGRYICKARKPECHRCPLTKICDYYVRAGS